MRGFFRRFLPRSAEPVKEDRIKRLLSEPSYETQVRTAAKDMENRARGVYGIPVVAVQISAKYALSIATLLRNHADDCEANRG